MEFLSDSGGEPKWLSLWNLYKVPILLGGASFLCIAVSLTLLIKSTRTVTPIEFSHGGKVEGVSSQASESARLAVDVEGAVVHAGIFSIPAGGRVEDALVAAGGLRVDADTELVAQTINRAMKVADGMKIYIPSKDETSHNGDSYVRPSGTSYNLNNSLNGAVVSVNMASKDDLDALPGVGPVTAQKIIDNRPYASLDDLVAKKAMGPSLFAKLKNRLSL